MDGPILETERLTLRPPVEEDLDAFVDIYSTDEIRRWLHIDDEVTPELVWSHMVSWVGQRALRGTGQLTVVERSTGEVIGRAGTHRPERHDWPGIEIGWAFHPAVWGNGFATEAGRACVIDALRTHPVDALYSLILHDNERSIGVAESLGFSHWEDREMAFFPDQPHGIWRMLRSEAPAWVGAVVPAADARVTTRGHLRSVPDDPSRPGPTG